jgi:hypothetical protein
MTTKERPMTRNTNARMAGVTLLVYFAVGLGELAVPRTSPVSAVLPMLTSFCALVLAVTLYALTRDQDEDLARLGMVCRVIEGIPRIGGELHFAVGSLLFSWLFLRGRTIPVPLARLGVAASALLVLFIPVQLAGYFGGPGPEIWRHPVTWATRLPLLLFELTLAVWLIVRGFPGGGVTRAGWATDVQAIARGHS